ncbi:MAG TPA: hypothetical protein VKP66_21140 [Steroidobacteraceae bacterium]|nr:hypothetical protein [Steroidobacteraceae bacterium]
MRALRTFTALLLASLVPAEVCLGADATDTRIALSANGETLTGTNGGGGASLGLLHNFDAESLGSVSVEHQGIANSNWTFGSVLGSLGRTWGGAHYSVYGEAHEGAGVEGTRHFHYEIEAVGVAGTFFRRLTATLEDRQISVPPTHGNLPKLSLSYLWDPHLSTTASFSSSVSGNLGTHLGAVRIDYYGSALNFLAGAAYGQASPVVLDINIGLDIPGTRLREGYAGFSKPFPHARGELTLVGDYLDLSGNKRVTLTLSYIFHIGHAGSAR